MRLKIALLFIIVFILSTVLVHSQEIPEILWQKKLDSYIGDFKVANNGTVIFFRKPDTFSTVADIVAVNKEGVYYWNKRFGMKIRNFEIAPSGDKIAVVYLQPSQTIKKPIITFIENIVEKWQGRGGTNLSFSPQENFILSYNDGADFKGSFLYDRNGKLIWYSESISIMAGQPDNQGRLICGLKDNRAIFLDTATGVIQSYPVTGKIERWAFDVQANLIFTDDGESVCCFEKNSGKLWEIKADQIYKLVPEPYRQRLLLYTPEKVCIVPYDNPKNIFNEANQETDLLRPLKITNEKYRFSDNLKYIATYKDNLLTMYQTGVN